MQAFVSIHDVSPDNFERVLNIIERLPTPCRDHLILLVIPGLEWSTEKIAKLRTLQKQGCILAGHGWLHRCTHITGWYHKLHSCLVSRNVAEHLALSEQEIQTLLSNCHQWFVDHDLDAPEYYVPPAWAMGEVSRDALMQSPFRYFESSWGIYDAELNQFYYLPLIGFEADTPTRSVILRAWNKTNEWISRLLRKPLRVSIHPHDPELLLRAKLWQSLQQVTSNQHFATLSSVGKLKQD